MTCQELVSENNIMMYICLVSIEITSIIHISFLFAGARSCFDLNGFLQKHAYIAPVKDMKNCLIFDEGVFKKGMSALTSPKTQRLIGDFCGVS